MRFAFKTANQYSTWAEILAVWREADAIELFESGWLFDHFYPIGSPQRARRPDAARAWRAGRCSQRSRRRRPACGSGLLVTGIHYRHPAVLANMVATTDIISGGRLELGIGAGWNEQESDAYGIELGSAARAARPLRRGVRGASSACSRRRLTDFDGQLLPAERAHAASRARCSGRTRRS